MMKPRLGTCYKIRRRARRRSGNALQRWRHASTSYSWIFRPLWPLLLGSLRLLQPLLVGSPWLLWPLLLGSLQPLWALLLSSLRRRPTTRLLRLLPLGSPRDDTRGDSFTPWSTVGRRSRRDTRPAPPHDAYLDARVSKLRHRSRSFPEGKRI